MDIVNVAIVENHALMRRSLVGFIEGLKKRFHVVFECATGKELVAYLSSCPEPDRPNVVLTGYQMPGMDGYEITIWLKRKFPDIKVVVFSSQYDDVVVVRLIKAGISGYLVKYVDGDEIQAALEAIAIGGTYFKDMNYVTITDLPEIEPAVRTWYSLTEIEREFVRLCTTELSDHEIKDKLGVSHYFREHPITKVYEKFGVRSRIALVLLVAKHRLIEHDP